MTANEHLAHLLQVQGGLLDAYLEQNLGRRYAYVILAWEQDPPIRLRVVTNLQTINAETARQQAQAWVARINALPEYVVPLDRSPRFLDLGP